jgi:REP element-mobilizing transposase RayT
MQTVIVGYHAVFGAFGFWLPNDPRGSWSEFVGLIDLYQFAGVATKTNERRSLAYQRHDHQKRRNAKSMLRRSPMKFTGIQARAIARGFSNYVGASGSPVWACSVMPDHVHLVTGRLNIPVEQFVIQMKGAAIRQLIEEGLHPYQDAAEEGVKLPKCFVRGHWSAYLHEPDVDRAIQYVRQNPVRQGLRPQHWSFVRKRS